MRVIRGAYGYGILVLALAVGMAAVYVATRTESGSGRSSAKHAFRTNDSNGGAVTHAAVGFESEQGLSARIVVGGLLGLTVQNVTPWVQRDSHLSSVEGALVTEVRKGSAAEAAGVQPGDVIREIGGVGVRAASEMAETARELKSGTKIEIKIEHRGSILLKVLEIS